MNVTTSESIQPDNTMMSENFDLGISLSQPRFSILTDDELLDLEKKKRSKRTDKATLNGANTLKKFCQETKVAVYEELQTLPDDELCSVLKKFWAGARKKDGK